MADGTTARRANMRGCLKALRHDTGGNTLAIMAAALVPMIGMAGSAIDIARMYYVKVRLQQACDAGVLAGRKFMDDTNTSSTLDANASQKAGQFFSNNFRTGTFGTTAVSFTPTKSADSQVDAVATATLPMTIMRFFGSTDSLQTVRCQARFDVADVDVMFVLDTTGSMACAANENSCSQPQQSYTRANGTTGYRVGEKSSSKIIALRAAVLGFFDTMAQNADRSTNIRYGIVPYTSTVNVGYQLPAGSLINDDWTYQSRRIVGQTNSGGPSDSESNNVAPANCAVGSSRTPGNGYDSSGRAYVTTVTYDPNGNSGSGKCRQSTQTVVPIWRHEPVSFDVRNYVSGASVADPTKLNGAMTQWHGCIEERDTTATGTFDVNALPGDLDPDLPATTRATRWRPMWPEVVYFRGDNATFDSTSDLPNLGDATYSASGLTSCGKSARRLAAATRADLVNYLNDPDFVPLGGTYHDVGMIWGTRMISPNGPFAADTAPHPNRNAPNRNIIFMTDGAMAPGEDIYGLYGHERRDRRITGGNLSTQLARHNARFSAICSAAKGPSGVTVWVIGFGSNGGLSPEMSSCASPGKTFFASDAPALDAAFRAIASQIAELRISQ